MDVEAIAEDVDNAFGHFSHKHKFGSRIAVRHGLKAIGDLVKDIAHLVEDCTAASGEKEEGELLKELLNVAGEFSDPVVLVFKVAIDLILNGVDIYEEIRAAIDAVHQHDYYHFGLNVGEALAQLILGSKAPEYGFQDVLGSHVDDMFLQ